MGRKGDLGVLKPRLEAWSTESMVLSVDTETEERCVYEEKREAMKHANGNIRQTVTRLDGRKRSKTQR